MSNLKNLKKFLAEFKSKRDEGECLGCTTPQLIKRTNHEEVHLDYRELYDVDLNFILATAKKLNLNVKIEALANGAKEFENALFIVMIYPSSL